MLYWAPKLTQSNILKQLMHKTECHSISVYYYYIYLIASSVCSRDVQDRSILKIHESGPSLPSDSPSSSPSRDLRLKALQQGYESDSSACSAPPSVGFHSPRFRGPSKMAGKSEVCFAQDFHGSWNSWKVMD